MVNISQTRDSLNLIAGTVSPLVIGRQFARLTGSGSRPICCVVMNDTSDDKPVPPKKVLSPAAKRALAEAAERRKARETAESLKPEKGGPKGVEPTRYGDWERGGIAYDF